VTLVQKVNLNKKGPVMCGLDTWQRRELLGAGAGQSVMRWLLKSRPLERVCLGNP